MVLWTILPEAAYNRLMAKGILRTDGRKTLDAFRESYRWMSGKLIEKTGKSRSTFPLWAWYKPKPDLRGMGHLRKGTVGYRVEFEIDEKNVLLSSFDGWHYVLNGGYYGSTEEETDDFYRRVEGLPVPFPEPFNTELITTWNKIFKFDENDSEEMIQATYWELHADWIIKVTRFIAR